MRANRRLQADERGVSEVIGAILVFGLAITLLAVLQTQAVPAANEDVEFNHNQEVQGDLVKFQEAASRTASQGTTESVRVQMGTTYPSRLLFFNPPNPSGQIRTVDSGTASIDNVEATDPTVQKYVDGSISGLDTRRVEYQPRYHETEDPPTTVLEYGVLYNDFGDQTLIQNPGNVVSGNNIDLMFYAGNLSTGKGGSIALNARPVSGPARTITVRPEDDTQPVSITIPSRLSAAEWEDILEDEDNFVTAVDKGDKVEIQLDGSVNRYTLRMPRIGVGSNVPNNQPNYIIGAKGPDETVPKNQAKTIAIEVRDRYNNPVRGEEVNISVSEGSLGPNSQTTVSVTSDNEGQAQIVYNAPSDTGSVDVYASIDSDPTGGVDETQLENTTFEIVVTERVGSRGPDVTANMAITDESDQPSLVGVPIGNGTAAFKVDWDAQLAEIDSNDGYSLDKVEIRMVHKGSNRIVDTAKYDLRGQDQASDETVLTHESESDTCGQDYRIDLVATSTGDKRHPLSDDVSSSCN